MCTWIYFIRRGYTDLSHLFFFNCHVFPEFSKLNDIFIFLEEDGRLFIIDNFKQLLKYSRGNDIKTVFDDVCVIEQDKKHLWKLNRKWQQCDNSLSLIFLRKACGRNVEIEQLNTISKRLGFCQGCHFCTEDRRWHEWNLSSGNRMTYLEATIIWRPPDNHFAAARELFWWPPYNASGGRYIILLGLDSSPLEFSKYTFQRTTFKDFLHYQEVWGDRQGVGLSPSRPLSPSSLFGAARAPRANFVLFLSPFLFFSPLPPPTPSSPSSRPVTSPSRPSSPNYLLPCPPPHVFLYAHFKIFCLASLACYYI